MEAGSKEFHEMRDQFEKDIKNVIYGHHMDRVGKDDKVPASQFYNDGTVNKLFHSYMLGYGHAKLNYI